MNEEIFFTFLKSLQKDYWKLHLLLSYLNEVCYVETKASHESHALAKCGETAKILIKLFTSIDSNLVNSDIQIIEYSIFGYYYPDHTFLIIKYKTKIYLLQSYYYSYFFSGKYGLQELSSNEYSLLEQILSVYDKYKIGKLTFESHEEIYHAI